MKNVLALLTASVAAAAIAATPAKPELMVLGVSHFGNPGQDFSNTKVEDVTTVDRQREIMAIVDRLATFHPTHVAVEWQASEQAKLDKRYADYRTGRLKLNNDETDQIGLRLAAKLNLPRVDAVDWNGEPPGKDEDYDFPGWAQKNGRGAGWDALRARTQQEADATGAYQRCHSVSDWIRTSNAAVEEERLEKPYFEIATFGNDDSNPGAAWVGSWYARNLRIFANLLRVGGVPGDRTIAIFGKGHGPLLRSDAARSGRFTIVPVARYLPSSGKPRC